MSCPTFSVLILLLNVCSRERYRTAEAQVKRIHDGRVRLARKAVGTVQMRANTSQYFSLFLPAPCSRVGVVQLQGFSMEKAVTYKIVRDRLKVVCEESIPTVLDGDTPQRIVSVDGYDLVYRIPGALRANALVSFLPSYSCRYFMSPPRTSFRNFATSGATSRRSRSPRPMIRRGATIDQSESWWVQPVCVRCGMQSDTR